MTSVVSGLPHCTNFTDAIQTFKLTDAGQTLRQYILQKEGYYVPLFPHNG